jgi:hypothetical protein
MMYKPTEKQRDDIYNRFAYHPPVPELQQAERYVMIRDRAFSFAEALIHNCPESRELSVALTHLDQVVMNANAAIARNESFNGDTEDVSL